MIYSEEEMKAGLKDFQPQVFIYENKIFQTVHPGWLPLGWVFFENPPEGINSSFAIEIADVEQPWSKKDD